MGVVFTSADWLLLGQVLSEYAEYADETPEDEDWWNHFRGVVLKVNYMLGGYS